VTEIIKANKINLSYRPHFLDSTTIYKYYNRDVTVEEIIVSLNIHHELLPQVLVQIGGVKIPRPNWHLVRPLPGAMVFISLVPMGGGGGGNKSLIQGIIGVALIAVGVIGFGLSAGLTSSLILTGAGMVLSAGASMLFPPPKPALSQSRYNSQESSQTYLLGSSSNAFKPFGPVLKLYGTHKMFPTIAAKPYTQWNANNNDFYTVFDLGIGKVDRDTLQIYIGSTPLSNYSDINYNIIYHPAEKFQIYLNDYETESFQVLIPTGGEVIRNTKADTEEFQVDIAFPQGLYSLDSNGNILSESVEISIEYQDAALVWHTYSDAPRYDLGTSGDSTSINRPITLYNNKAYTFSYYNTVWGVSTYPITTTYYYIAKGTTSIRANVMPPNGSTVNINGAKYKVLSNNGTSITIDKPIPTEIFLYTSTSLSTSYNVPGVLKLTANKQNPTYFTLIVGGLPPAIYPIRIKKITTSGAGSLKHINEMYLAQIKSVKYKAPIVTTIPHTFLEMKIKANEQLSGTLDNVSIIGSSVLDTWDVTAGAWVEKPTNNPAWIFVDILTGPVNGNPVLKDRLHLPSIIEWANYCDTLRTFNFTMEGQTAPVTEKNSVCSFVLDFDTTVMQLLTQVCSAGRATFSVIGGKYGVIIDQQKTIPVQVLTERNYNNFSSSRSYIKMPHALKVKFVDPESDWNISEQLVYNTEDGYNAGNSTIFESIDTFGCNTPSFAWRLGRYWLAQTRLRQEKINIEMDFENLVMLKGDLVDFQSQIMKVGGYPVRIIRITGATIYFDTPIDSPGGTPGFEVRTRAGTIISGQLTSVAPNGLSVTVPNSSGMNVGDLFVFGIFTRTSIKCLVENIVPSDDMKASVTLVEYAPAIFNADIGPIPPYDPQINPPGALESTPPKIDNAILQEEIIYRNTQAISKININIFVPPGTVWNATAIYWLNELLEWELVQTIAGSALEFFLEEPASENFKNIVKDLEFSYRFSLIGNNGNHLPVESLDTYSIILKGDLVLPLPPAKLSMNTQVDTLLITWDPPLGVPDLGAFLVKYSPTFDTNISFNEFSFFIDKVPALATSVKVSFRPGQYAVRSMDTSGNVSAESIRAIASSPDVILTKNISSYSPESLGWPDTKKDVVVISNEIQLLQTAPNATVNIGYYYFNNLLDLGEIYTARVSSFLQGYGLELGVYLTHASWDPMSNRAAMNDVAEDEAKYYLEVRLTNQTFFISFWADMASINPIAQGAVQWSPWQKIFVGDVTTRLIEFRIVLERNSTRLNITPVVKSGKVDVEIPFTQRTFTDEIVPGTRNFVFNPQFWEVPSLSIIAQDLQTGDYYTVTNKDGIGFDLNFFDLNGIPVTRTADIQALGTGRRYIQVLG